MIVMMTVMLIVMVIVKMIVMLIVMMNVMVIVIMIVMLISCLALDDMYVMVTTLHIVQLKTYGSDPIVLKLNQKSPAEGTDIA